MPRLHHTALNAAVSLGALALAVALLAPGSASAQPRIPVSASWKELPRVVPEGATATPPRAGSKASRRPPSSSMAARFGRFPPRRSFRSKAGAGGRPVKRGAHVGFRVGLVMASLYAAAAAPRCG
jgi:hypothetical protein